MRRRAGENALWTAAASCGLAAMAWLGLGEFAFNDYDNEARPAVEALVHGHVSSFFALAPSYGGSLLERAPFALAPSLWGGGELAVYRMMALPCLLAAGALGLWLVDRMRRDRQSIVASAVALTLCVANPITLLALEIGHPDELLGGALCVAAVLLAVRGRAAWAGLALGVAIANKEWALLAVGPVLLALPAKRALCMSIAAGASAVFLGPFLLAGSGFLHQLQGAATSTGVAGSAGTSFQPWQIWWFLGAPAHALTASLGAIPAGARVAPGWVESVSHPLIVALALPLTLAAWLTTRRGRASDSPALALLALLLAERCMLDPWDNIYYPLPFVLALLAWEAIALRRLPVLALLATAVIWADHGFIGSQLTPDVQSAVFDALTVPLAGLLAARLYVRPLLDARQALRKPGEDLAAVFCHDHQILDAHAEAAL